MAKKKSNTKSRQVDDSSEHESLQNANESAPTEAETTTNDNEKENNSEPVESDKQQQQDGKSETVTEQTPAAVSNAEQPQPQPQPQPVKKRLTLQERLALAAAGKANKTASPSPSPSPSPTTAAHPAPTPASNEPSTETKVEVKKHTETTKELSTFSELNFPKNFFELDQTKQLEIMKAMENKLIALNSKNDSLRTEKQSLQEKLSTVSKSSVNDQLIKQKDDKIQQLIKEGESLALKELNLNNTIKKLRSKESANDFEIKDLKKQIEGLKAEKSKLEGTIKSLQASEQQASLTSKTLQVQLNNEKEALKEEIKRSTDLSKQIEELNHDLIGNKKASTIKINELKAQIEREKQKFSALKEESILEVNRLETKIEQLRFQSENSQALNNSNNINNDESHLKLLKQHEILQKQYTSATENWQSIEASLMHKISNLESELDLNKENLNQNENKISILQKDLIEYQKKNDMLVENYNKLSGEHETLKKEFSELDKLKKQLEDDVQDKEIKYTKEKNTLEFKVNNLEKQIKESVQQQSLMYESSPNISTSSFKRNSNINWEIGFGESSFTPKQSRRPSAYNFNNSSRQSSILPNASLEEIPDDISSMNADITQDEDDDDNISDFGENEIAASSPNVSFHQSRHENSLSTIGAGGGAGSSVQLIGKLSGQIRRLETEKLILKTENDQLSNIKKESTEEIVKLMKENEQVENLKKEIQELESKVDSYTKKYESTLEILGEKSEQVEELKADIADLKDLLREQVQQIVELQNK